MFKTIIKTTRYCDCSYDTEVWIDIIEFDDMFEAWLTVKEYGISELMFGAPKEQKNFGVLTHENFVAMVQENLCEYVDDIDME